MGDGFTVILQFLSTPSVGEATDANCGGRRLPLLISIHALRGEGDTSCWIRAASASLFLSTPSVGRATSTRCNSII